MSVALTIDDLGYRPSGMKEWAKLPADGAPDQASFGSANYYRVRIPAR